MKTCLVCDNPVHGKGLCRHHYNAMRWLTLGKPKTARPAPLPNTGRCVVPGCKSTTATSQGRGMCPMHYQRWRKHGDPAIKYGKLRAKSLIIAG